MYTEIKELKGKIFSSVEKIDNDKVLFTTADGKRYKMYHQQDCCESVYIEDINGDLQDLVGSPILLAEKRTSNEDPEGYTNTDMYRDSYTWTFYTIATIKGYVTIRWLGESNGYYSESVDIIED